MKIALLLTFYMLLQKLFHQSQHIVDPGFRVGIFGSAQDHPVIHRQGQKLCVANFLFVLKIIIFRISDIRGAAENMGVGTEANHILQQLLLHIFLQTGNILVNGFGILVPAVEEHPAVFRVNGLHGIQNEAYKFDLFLGCLKAAESAAGALGQQICL